MPRPQISTSLLLLIGLTLFAGQFLLQFFAIAGGMPPGLASVVVQTQAFFTVIFAAFTLGDNATRKQVVGMVVAFTGLLMIGLTLGRGLTILGFVLTLGSAISWSIGNVLLKRLENIEMLPLVVWCSLVPPLPALALSIIMDGSFLLPRAVANASWLSLAAVLYLGVGATIFAYAIWGKLLNQYPTAAVTPFALLTPAVGALSSAIVFGEQFEPLRLTGMILMVVALIIVVLPARQLMRRGIEEG